MINMKKKEIDFTFKSFKLLCTSLKRKDYTFITFSEICSDNKYEKYVIMRHDVDRNVKMALEMAKIEKEMDIQATYYFRRLKNELAEKIIRKIDGLGHEIGYHYEDFCGARGNFEKAISSFQENLDKLRELYPVKTICMHGSPLSNWDNRMLWQKYNYRDFELIGEPFFDIDYNKTLYLTDTGRRWDGESVSVRDKVFSNLNYRFRSTADIIGALNNNELPDKLMINIHPHRWTDKTFPRIIESMLQPMKNVVKRILIKISR